MTVEAAPETSGATNEETLASNWKWLLLDGALMILVGVIALFAPISAVYAMTIVWGAFAFVDGIFSIAAGIGDARRRKEHWVAMLLRGALGLMAGIVVLVMPLVATVALVAFTWAMISIWSVVTGIMEVAAAIRLRKEMKKEWLLALSGVVSILFGLAVPVLLVMYPAASLLAMGYMIGFWAFLHGALTLALALKLKKAGAKA